jgi:hypothetical protein
VASIQEECTSRNIDCLFHFTPVEYLHSILKHGLLVPSVCAKLDTGVTPNDAFRYDAQDAICLSVEWPNYKLFYSFRQRDTSRQWALIAIRHSVLWEKRVCFNTTNAADNSMSSQAFAARQGLAKFQELFGDWSGKVRADLQLTDNLPTNPQAEVLCLDTIEPTKFYGVLLDDLATYKALKEKYANFEFMQGAGYFGYRTDWSHWKNG